MGRHSKMRQWRGRDVCAWGVRYSVAATAVGAGLVGAYALRWVCDDIFITLRYIENAFEGMGLVYNQGEYVEGYTHFLWLCMLAAGRWLGLDPVAASVNLGLASLAATLAVFSAISARVAGRAHKVVFPFTALALAVHYDFLIWASGGLETMFLTLLLASAFYTYYFTELTRPRKLLLTGLALALATLTRPDALLVLAVANGLLLARHVIRGFSVRGVLRDAALVNLPFAAIVTPYVAWKLNYYGDVFPNSYYAKSGYLTYYSRGLYYLWLYLRAYWSSALFVVGAAVLARALVMSSAGRGGLGQWRSAAAAVLAERRWAALAGGLVGVAVYLTLFVARVGGDFMYARFIVPAVPFMLYSVEVSLRELLARRRRTMVLVLAALVGFVGIVERHNRQTLLLSQEDGKVKVVSHKGIIDERHYYKYESNRELEIRWAKAVEPTFRDLDVTVVLVGQAVLGYYGKFKTCIEFYGLTDRYIARQPLEKRSRVGHEKRAPLEYLVDRGADFLLGRMWPFGETVKKYRRFTMRLPGVRVGGYFITYDRELIRALVRRFGSDFKYSNFEAGLDKYIAEKLPQRDYETLLAEYMEFRDYYFKHNDDNRREAAFLNRLRELSVTQRPRGDQ